MPYASASGTRSGIKFIVRLGQWIPQRNSLHRFKVSVKWIHWQHVSFSAAANHYGDNEDEDEEHRDKMRTEEIKYRLGLRQGQHGQAGCRPARARHPEIRQLPRVDGQAVRQFNRFEQTERERARARRAKARGSERGSEHGDFFRTVPARPVGGRNLPLGQFLRRGMFDDARFREREHDAPPRCAGRADESGSHHVLAARRD